MLQTRIFNLWGRKTVERDSEENESKGYKSTLELLSLQKCMELST